MTVSAADLNSLLRRGLARADELEARLARILEPVFQAAADRAAARFVELAVPLTVTAAGPDRERIPLVGPPPLTAAIAPEWTPPASADLVDVDELVGQLRGKTDPVRLAVAQSIMGESMKLTDPLQSDFRYEIVMASELGEDAEEVVLGWPGEAEDVGGAAISGVRDMEEGVLYELRDRATGEVVAVAQVERGADSLIVHNIASGRSRAGTTLLQMVAQNAAADGLGVRLVATPEAEGYYRRLPGWEQQEGRQFLLPAEKAGGFGTGTLTGVPKPNASGVGLAFDVDNPHVGEMLAKSADHVTAIAETTRSNVRRTIAAAYREGLSVPDTAKVIRAGMAEAAGARATMIARTELGQVANGSALAAARLVSKATGTEFTKTWLTGAGARHPRHELYPGLDGQTVPLDGLFNVGGYLMPHPGDGPASEVINCRCSMSFGDEPIAAPPPLS